MRNISEGKQIEAKEAADEGFKEIEAIDAANQRGERQISEGCRESRKHAANQGRMRPISDRNEKSVKDSAPLASFTPESAEKRGDGTGARALRAGSNAQLEKRGKGKWRSRYSTSRRSPRSSALSAVQWPAAQECGGWSGEGRGLPR